MSRPEHQYFEWSAMEGGVTDLQGRYAMSSLSVPDHLALSAENCSIHDGTVLVPRPGFLDYMNTSGTEPTVGIRYLVEQTSGSGSVLWAWASNGSAAMTAHAWDGSTWTNPTLSDTVATLAEPHCVQFNGKMFAAYDSDQNRLHVWDGSAFRRVGVIASAAATVANTGAGAYAATLRYYKIRFYIVASSVTQASSELSPSVSFTPSGAGTAARVTKPTTPDSATHWAVYASSDDRTYYNLSGQIAVGTTTYDDSTAPSAYSSLTVAEDAGLFVPPPSCKYLATDGTRLLMAGAWETSASSGQTTPKSNRVWFTRPLGATDEGDDESITTTSDLRYWIDVNDERSQNITGLMTLDGMVYVFFASSCWRLVPTDIDETPYRAELVSSAAGAHGQKAIIRGGLTGASNDAVYFIHDATGLYRVSTGYGVEHLGYDIFPRYGFSALTNYQLAYDRVRRDLWICATTTQGYVLSVDFIQRVGHEFHGGARKWSTSASYIFAVGAMFGTKFILGGGTTDADLATPDDQTSSDSGGTAYNGIVTKRFVAPPGQNMRLYEPIVYASGAFSSATITVAYANYEPLFGTIVSSAVAVTNFGVLVKRLGGVQLADVAIADVSLSVTGQLSQAFRIDRVIIPYTVQEAR